MKGFIVIMIIFGAIAAAKAQVEPEATSAVKLAVSGTLTYSARYSQIAQFYNKSTGQMASASGNFGYSTTSERRPTSISLGAGDNWRISGLGFSTGPYENLIISQGLNGQHWLLTLRDELSFRHGVGLTEPNPSSATSTAEPIETDDTPILDNDATARLSDRLSGSTTLSASAGFNQLEYPDGNGLGTDTFRASLEMNRRLEARDSIFGEYSFAQYGYSTGRLTIDANTAVAGWHRGWNRKISTSVSAGPQWLIFQASVPIPSFAGYTANATIDDSLRFGSAAASFTHGVNGGGGYLYGAELNNFSGSFTRQFGHNVRKQLTVELLGGYRFTDTLSSTSSIALPGGFGAQQDYTTKYGYAQASRRLGRLFSVYANYTATEQSPSNAGSSALLNGLYQTVSFGIGFTPPSIHLRQ
ncbi:MAG: hypothetical protein WBP85_04615 [Terracidiphilus sp.]